MKTPYYLSLSKIKAYRQDRDTQKEFIYANPAYLPELVQIACNHKDKNHQKALWIIELICIERIEIFAPYIEDFCNVLMQYKGDSTFRPASKICMCLAQSKLISLTENQEEKIIEFCLDRAIDFRKSASLSYATHALFSLGKKHAWVYDEMQFIFEKDLPQDATPGVKFTVKDILIKLNKKRK